MKKPQLPPNEEKRLEALESYAVLDTFPEQVFDDITRLAAEICGTPISLVSLVDEQRQWFKSHHGLDATETPRDIAYCAHAINDPSSIFEIQDSETDERFHDNPLFTGEPHVRFYAGAPLVNDDGFALGTLCVIDHKAKKLTKSQRESLSALSRQVVLQLELRKQAKDLKLSRVAFENSSEGQAWINEKGDLVEYNDRFREMAGFTKRKRIVPKAYALFTHLSESAWEERWMSILKQKQRIVESAFRRADGKRQPVELRLKVQKYEDEYFVLAVCIDITDRKREQKRAGKNLKLLQMSKWELERNAQLLEQVQSIAKIGYWELNLVSSDLFWSRETRRIHEVDEDYVPNLKEGINFYDEPSQVVIAREIERAIETGGSWDIKLRIISAKGNPRWVRTIGQVNRENNEPVSLYGVFQDISEEVSMREELSQREELYRLISENTSDLICLQTPAGQYTYVSPSVQTMLGYSPKELIDKKTGKFIHPDDRNRVEHALTSSVFGKGKTVKLEYRLKKKKGGYAWVEMVSKPVVVDEYIVSIQSAARDITDRKEKEQTILQNEANLMALVENTTDFIWSIDNQHRYITFNSIFREAVITQTGAVPKTGDKWHMDLLPKKLAAYWMPLYERAFGGERFIAESQAKVKGEKRSYENSFNPIFDKQGNVTGVAVFSRDVTDKQRERDKKRKFQQGLRLLNSLAIQKEEKFEDLIVRSLALVAKFLRLPMGILSRIEGNDYYVHGFFSRSEDSGLFIGQRFDLQGTYCDITYQKNRVVAIEDMEASSYSGHPCYQSFKLGTYIGAIVMVKDKRFGTVNLSDSKSRSTTFDKYDREFLQLFANWIGAEIERRQNEEHLKQAKEKAESASVAKENFLSTMSHEIRTPLNAIIGMTHILLDEKPRKDQRENLELVKFSSENLLVLVNDVLDYNKIAANKLIIDEHSFNLKNLLHSIKGSNSFKVQEKGIKFKLYYDEDIPSTLIGDASRIAQVINNLVSNAIKFTEKGSVKLFVELGETWEDRVSVDIAVEDTGIGIEKEKHEAIFDRFTQAESSTSRKFGGTGLGLSITRKLLELMGSSIKVHSEVGKGARFSFSLTLKKEDGNEQETNGTMNVGFEDLTSHNIKVLVAEDNKANQLVVKKFFQKWGISATFANNGIEAVNKVKEKGYQLLLMDLQMPEMDGFEATKKIRAMKAPYFSTLPIVALTASVMNNVKGKATELGMNDFITKPFAPIDLYNIVVKHTLKKGRPMKVAQTVAQPKTNGTNDKTPERNYGQIMDEFTMGDASFKQELAVRYTSNLIELRDEFPVLLKESRTKELRDLAHKVKFTLHFLGAKEISGYIERAQELAETVNTEEVIDSFSNEFRASCNQVIDALKEIEATTTS